MAFNSLCKDDLLRPRIRSTLSLTPRSRSSYQTPSLTELQRLLWTHKPSTGHVNEVWPNLYVGDLYTARDKEQLRRMGITHIVNAAAGRFHIDTGAKFYRDLPVDYYGIEADDDPNFDLSIYFYQAARYIRAALNSPRELHLRPDSVLLHYCKSRVMPLKSELLHIYASVTEQETFPARVQLNANANLQFLIKSAEGEESSVDIDERSPWKIIRLTTCGEKGRVLVHCAMGISRSATLVLAFLMICENKTLVDAIQAVCKHRGVCPNSGFLKQLWELDMRLAREKGRGIDPLRL